MECRRRTTTGGREHRARPAVAALAVVAALALVGCGDDDGGAGTSSRLEATEFEFSPAQVTAQAGEHEFQLVNRGETEHALEIHAPGGEVVTDRVAPGESATVTADLSETGTYELYCPVGDHRQRGMEGSVTVKQAGGEDSAPAY